MIEKLLLQHNLVISTVLDLQREEPVVVRAPISLVAHFEVSLHVFEVIRLVHAGVIGVVSQDAVQQRVGLLPLGHAVSPEGRHSLVREGLAGC